MGKQQSYRCLGGGIALVVLQKNIDRGDHRINYSS